MRKRTLCLVAGIITLSLLGACGNKQAGETSGNLSVEVSEDSKEEVKESKKELDKDVLDARAVLDEMCKLSSQAWKDLEKRSFDTSKEKFESLISKKDEFLAAHQGLSDKVMKMSESADSMLIYVKDREIPDVITCSETMDWLDKDTTYEWKYIDTEAIDNESIDELLLAIDTLCMDAYAGLTEEVWSQAGQYEARDYAKALYQESKDVRLRTISELFALDSVQTSYEMGYADEDFLKAESERLIPVLQGKLKAHAGNSELLLNRWKKPLALFYYMIEDFDTYLYIEYDGQDVDEVEPVEVIDNEEATYLENKYIGLRWNEEEEEYEEFTLRRFFGYAEYPSKDVVYCDVKGKFSSHTYHPSVFSSVSEKFSFDEDGRIKTRQRHMEYTTDKLPDEDADSEYSWTSNMPKDLKDKEDWLSILLDAFYEKDREEPLYYITEVMHGVTGDFESTDKYDLYGVVIFD